MSCSLGGSMIYYQNTDSSMFHYNLSGLYYESIKGVKESVSTAFRYYRMVDRPKHKIERQSWMGKKNHLLSQSLGSEYSRNSIQRETSIEAETPLTSESDRLIAFYQTITGGSHETF